ncbi:hypothetical protein C900_05475 [Fulvivirga imtechensis AK7]|uniref:Uncharacterized protein n=1 Tax=Fulvivirga imtechensis AK7 TaxID=1237149 RepID=L8JJK0_9BACT|nr:hypothetical protein [Fulvivirga imtechensis]ELR69086.1 hypothetical protein C900_05475 [Fulvivirga imtechensis AK7]
MAIIDKKKNIYRISKKLRAYLIENDREIKLPITYQDLLRYDNSIPLLDKNNKDTLWESVFYPQDDMKHIHYSLKKIYAILKADGDLSVMEHLFVDRIDLCIYGNTQPFRVRIVNRINDNFDYFYIKNADASRIYGLELEHLLSPNRISYFVDDNTLIEEHIIGIPGDQFMKYHLHDKNLNKIRLAKEFVKFNERCFVRLLGDMHSSNFVIDITPDFEEIDYRIRAIDFDQQSYEGRKSIYLPQYFKQNNPLIKIGLQCMTPETVKQYQKEERSLIATRVKASRDKIKQLLVAMSEDKISPQENVDHLKKELATHYKNKDFLKCGSMGEILKKSLQTVLDQKPSYHFP